MTTEDLRDAIKRVMSEYGRRRWSATGDDPRAVGRLGGRKPVPTRCPRCNKLCKGWRLAQAHCRRKRSAKKGE